MYAKIDSDERVIREEIASCYPTTPEVGALEECTGSATKGCELRVAASYVIIVQKSKHELSHILVMLRHTERNIVQSIVEDGMGSHRRDRWTGRERGEYSKPQ
jgi:hypothetical protein